MAVDKKKLDANYQLMYNTRAKDQPARKNVRPLRNFFKRYKTTVAGGNTTIAGDGSIPDRDEKVFTADVHKFVNKLILDKDLYVYSTAEKCKVAKPNKEHVKNMEKTFKREEILRSKPEEVKEGDKKMAKNLTDQIITDLMACTNWDMTSINWEKLPVRKEKQTYFEPAYEAPWI